MAIEPIEKGTVNNPVNWGDEVDKINGNFNQVVLTVNNQTPDSNGNVTVSGGGGGVTSVNGQTGVVTVPVYTDAQAQAANATALSGKVDKVTGQRLITSAEATLLANTSGTNTGDETTSTIKSKLGITTLSGNNTGDQDLSGYVPNTVTINSKPLSGNITLTPTDIGAQTPLTFDSAPIAGSNNPVTSGGIFTAVQAITPTIQPETSAFITRINATGSKLEASEINGFDSFFVKGKNDGWLSNMKWLWCPMGNNIVSAAVNLYYASGVPASLINNNFVDADYTKLLGAGTGSGTNTNKFFDTGFTPLSLGLNGNNVSFGVFAPQETTLNAFYMGLNPSSGNTSLYVKSFAVVAGQDGTNGVSSVTGYSPCGVSISYGASNAVNGYINGTGAINSTTTVVTNTVLDTNLTLFKSKTTYCPGKLGFAFMGSYLTPAQNKSLSDAIYKLMQDIGRLNLNGSRIAGFGDSITLGAGASKGINRWMSLLAKNIGAREHNVGVGSSQLRQTIPGTGTTSGILGGFQRYLDMVNVPVNTVAVMYGTNDMNNADSTSTGDATLLADYQSKLTTIVNSWKADNKNVIIFSPPWNAVSSTPAARRNAWQAVALAVAKATGVKFVDTETLFTDTGTPSTFFTDGLHPGDIGHSMISNLGASVLQGRTYRHLVLDFPSIAAGGSATLNVTMLNTIVGQNAIASQDAPTAGIIYTAAVTAADTVTITATNVTGASIDPASGYFRVTVFLDL